jgi:hypothetical protein
MNNKQIFGVVLADNSKEVEVPSFYEMVKNQLCFTLERTVSGNHWFINSTDSIELSHQRGFLIAVLKPKTSPIKVSDFGKPGIEYEKSHPMRVHFQINGPQGFAFP